jgi:hypothetical protein
MQKLSSYPVESWRPNQREYADRVLELATSQNESRTGLQGPCGCGKSIGYLRPLLDPSAPKSMVLTTTRQHLKQLEETLERYYSHDRASWAILRGRSFYSCCGQKKPNDASKNPITAEDRDPEAEWSEEPAENSSKCPLGDDGCLYRKAVFAAARAQVVVQCTIGGLYRKLYWGELEVGEQSGADSEKARRRAEWIRARRDVVDRELAVLDEAHEYLRVRRDFETQKLDLWLKGIIDPRRAAALNAARSKPGGYVAGYVLLEADSPLRLMMIAEFERLLEPANVEKMLPAGKHLDNRDEIKRKWVEKLEVRRNVLRSGDVVSVQWEGWGASEKASLVSEPLFAGVREKLARVEIFTSATLEDVWPLISTKGDEIVAYPEIFDWDSSVTVCALDDNAGGSGKNVALDAATLESIYNAPGRPLTIVLFLSKKQAHEAAKNIARQPGVFVQGLDKDTDLGELVELVRRHGVTFPGLSVTNGQQDEDDTIPF